MAGKESLKTGVAPIREFMMQPAMISLSPAQLAQPGTAGDERPLLRAETQRRVHGPILLVIEMSSETVREDRRLNDAHDGV